MEIITAIIQKRFDTWDNWIRINPVLKTAEEGFILSGLNAGRSKTGNGVARWNSLPFDDGYAIQTIENNKNEINNVLKGVNKLNLSGAFLTRAIAGVTEVPLSLFPSDTVFVAGKTLIFDNHGTEGVYVEDWDNSNITVMTTSTSQIGAGTTPNLGTVQTHAELPLTVTAAVELFGRTPSLNDYATVRVDETMDDNRVEWYITDIDENGNITWGNPVPIDTSSYQEKTGLNMAGKLLTGGSTAGTFGEAVDIEEEPVEGSDKAVLSGGIFSAISNVLKKETVRYNLSRVFFGPSNITPPSFKLGYIDFTLIGGVFLSYNFYIEYNALFLYTSSFFSNPGAQFIFPDNPLADKIRDILRTGHVKPYPGVDYSINVGDIELLNMLPESFINEAVSIGKSKLSLDPRNNPNYPPIARGCRILFATITAGTTFNANIITGRGLTMSGGI